MMEATTEIRKLRPAELYNLARILSASDSWKTLMAVVPKEENENIPKFNTEHFVLIEQASCQKHKSAAEIFLEEWSTMGKRRPTLESTLNLLVKAQLFRAADYIAVDLLRGVPPKRPACGPAAQIEITDEEIEKLINNTNSEYEMPSCPILVEDSLDSVLDDIGYPSELSVSGSEDRRVPETRPQNENGFENSTVEMLNLRLKTAENLRENSNLIEFSKTESVLSEEELNEVPVECINTNLIKFSSESIVTQTGAYNSLSDYPEVVLQRWNNAETSYSNTANDSSSRKKLSANIIGKENSENSSDFSRVNEFSSSSGTESESTSNESNSNDIELRSSELPAFVADIGRGTSSSAYGELKSSELPQFIAEICNRD